MISMKLYLTSWTKYLKIGYNFVTFDYSVLLLSYIFASPILNMDISLHFCIKLSVLSLCHTLLDRIDFWKKEFL